jgi:pimeloyl-[acyl-carrier protein] methyl ester esterase
MITEWIVRQGAEEVVLFFSGWGMDRRIADHLSGQSASGPAYDVVSFHDYRTGQIDASAYDGLCSYRKRTVVAWSFGVWSAVHAKLPPVSHAVAVNGTLSPVDSEEGIDPEVFQATLDTYSDANRLRFNRRMCGGGDALEHFLSVQPERISSCQREELARLSGRLQGDAGPEGFRYDHVIIGGRDMIFPASRQFAAWRGYPQTVITDMPHYPFFHLSSLEEVLECSRA